MTTYLNATSSAMSGVSLGSLADNSWLITLGVFAGILFLIFILSKNFRQFIYGAVVSGFLIIVYKVSRWIGVATSIEHNYSPIKIFLAIGVFIILSIVIGKILAKLPYIKKIEKEWDFLPAL